MDVDCALCDGREAWIGGIMQHVEEAGVHSGDSACVLPPHSLGGEMLEQIRVATRDIALQISVVGLLNVQYAVVEGQLYVIEANPRASRTVPFVSKAVGLPLAKLACRVMLGEPISALGLPREQEGLGFGDHISVKEAVLPFDRFEGADAVLGPEMRSTGEVMGIARDFPTAFAKAQAAAGAPLPLGGTAFISVTDSDKDGAFAIAQILHDNGFRILATARHRGRDRAHGRTRAGAEQDRRGLPARRGLDRARRRGPRDKHAHRLRRAHRWLADPPRRGHPRDSLPDDARRRGLRRTRDLERPPGRAPARALPAGAAPRAGRHRGALMALAPFARRPLTVVALERLGAYTLLRAADPEGPAPDPGQFAMLAAVEGWGAGQDERPHLPRAFSYARAAADGEVSFLLEDVGPGTRRLCELRPGEQLWALGPLGIGFTAPAEGRRAILLGGGAGIAPLAIWQDALLADAAAGTQPPTVLLGFRDGEHAAGAVLLREARIATDDGAVGHRGLVTELLDEELARGRHATVYACGPAPMLEAVRALCAERAIPAQLALESGMACGFGACFGCVVPRRGGGYLRVCVDGPVLDAAELEHVDAHAGAPA